MSDLSVTTQGESTAAAPAQTLAAADASGEQARARAHPLAGTRPVLVVNTRARRGAAVCSDAERKLKEAGIELAACHSVRRPERVPDIVRRELAQGCRTVILGGGDGTISSVVDHLAHGRATLGLLPLGTANSFARTIGVPLDLDGAIKVLLAGETAEVDLGIINGDRFANTASIGLAAAVAEAVPHGLKRWLGRMSYPIVGLSRLARHAPFRCTVTIDGRSRHFATLDVTLAIGAYQGGVRVVDEARPDDGDVVLHILTSTSKIVLLTKWLGHALGLELARDRIEVLRVREAVIDTEPKQAVTIDGEVAARTPLRISVARRALRVMAPRAFAASLSPPAGAPASSSPSRTG